MVSEAEMIQALRAKLFPQADNAKFFTPERLKYCACDEEHSPMKWFDLHCAASEWAHAKILRAHLEGMFGPDALTTKIETWGCSCDDKACAKNDRRWLRCELKVELGDEVLKIRQAYQLV
jgi:hypothetical protein